MNMNKLVLTSLLCGAAVFGTLPAYASLSLSLFDGTNTVNVTDTTNFSLGDMDNSANAILAQGTLGVWNYKFQIAESNAPGGIPSFLTLESQDKSTGAGTLTVTLTETGFLIPATPSSLFSTSLGGTTDNGVLTGAITGNILLNGSPLGATMVPTIVTGSLNSSFAQNQTSYGNTVGGFSLAQVLTLTHSGAQKSDLNVQTQVVPEPVTLGLLGLGLLGLGFARRRMAA